MVVDTPALVGSLTGPRDHLETLRGLASSREQPVLTTLVLYEWRRGPRSSEELDDQEALLPSELAVPFGPVEAEVGARIYRSVQRARTREIDIAIAACAIVRDAALWTLNREDFEDIPGLLLWR